jgi:hypothetical protein
VAFCVDSDGVFIMKQEAAKGTAARAGGYVVT